MLVDNYVGKVIILCEHYNFDYFKGITMFSQYQSNHICLGIKDDSLRGHIISGSNEISQMALNDFETYLKREFDSTIVERHYGVDLK